MTLVIDIGGTHLRALIEDIYFFEEIETKNVELSSYIISKLREFPKIKEVKISFAGQVYNGKILSSPNIEVKVKNIKDYIESKYSVVLKIENDLKCAALAEAKELNENYLSALYVGTGIGSGTVENGKLIRGFRNLAGEIGHIPYKKAPFKCGCGKDNCIELYASGIGLKKWIDYKKLSIDVDLASVKREAKDIYDEFERALLFASATIATLFNPKVLVLGGGVIKNNPYLVDLIKENIKFFALNTSLKDMKILKSKLEDASLKGAKLL